MSRTGSANATMSNLRLFLTFSQLFPLILRLQVANQLHYGISYFGISLHHCIIRCPAFASCNFAPFLGAKMQHREIYFNR